jgi:hypothetical protein
VALDLTSLGPLHECVCGSTMFKTLVSFENGEIVWYTLTGYCAGCGAKCIMPTPVDRIS